MSSLCHSENFHFVCVFFLRESLSGENPSNYGAQAVVPVEWEHMRCVALLQRMARGSRNASPRALLRTQRNCAHASMKWWTDGISWVCTEAQIQPVFFFVFYSSLALSILLRMISLITAPWSGCPYRAAKSKWKTGQPLSVGRCTLHPCPTSATLHSLGAHSLFRNKTATVISLKLIL